MEPKGLLKALTVAGLGAHLRQTPASREVARRAEELDQQRR